MTLPKHVQWIANPKGGVGDNVKLAQRACDVLKSHGVGSGVTVTEHAGHARSLVQEIAWEEGHAIGGIGGDGTMHELVNGLMSRRAEERMPLTLLPGGTGNSFLRDLDRIDPEGALEGLAALSSRSIDLFEVRVGPVVRYGFNIIGWGLFSHANELAEALRWMGRRRYDIAALIRLVQNNQFDGRLEFDGQVVGGGFSVLAAANTMYTGLGMKLAPQARLDDGKLDLVFLRNTSRRMLLNLFRGLGTGRHVERPEVEYHQVREFSLVTEEGVSITLDGELIEGGSFAVRVLPGALSLLL